jgi:hypothetical protein
LQTLKGVFLLQVEGPYSSLAGEVYRRLRSEVVANVIKEYHRKRGLLI